MSFIVEYFFLNKKSEQWLEPTKPVEWINFAIEWLLKTADIKLWLIWIKETNWTFRFPMIFPLIFMDTLKSQKQLECKGNHLETQQWKSLLPFRSWEWWDQNDIIDLACHHHNAFQEIAQSPIMSKYPIIFYRSKKWSPFVAIGLNWKESMIKINTGL